MKHGQQAEMARKLGITQNTLCAYRKGRAGCPAKTWGKVQKMAAKLGITGDFKEMRKSHVVASIPKDFVKLVKSCKYRGVELAKHYEVHRHQIHIWCKKAGVSQLDYPKMSDALLAKEVGVSRQYLQMCKIGKAPCSKEVWKKIKGRVSWTPRVAQKRGRPLGSKNRKKGAN